MPAAWYAHGAHGEWRDVAACVTLQNVPYFPEIYALSGYTTFTEKFGSASWADHCRPARSVLTLRMLQRRTRWRWLA